MRPVFVGNLDYDARQSELERLFGKYGPIERIDIKSGYAFIYFEDERDGEDAIRRLDNVPFGYNRRRLSVEWSRQDVPGSRTRERPPVNTKPTRTLFVINFDPLRTRVRDIERHFEAYGRIVNIRVRRNFAFVQYESQDEATNAVKHTDKSQLLDRILTVEYAFRDDDNERDDRMDSPRRERRYPSPYGRSPSPRYGRSPSPRYGRSPSPRYRKDRGSPDYGRSRQPAYERERYRSRSPNYARY